MRAVPLPLALLTGSAVILAACGDGPSAVDHTPALVQVFSVLPTSLYLTAGGLNYFPETGTFCVGVDPASPSTVTARESATNAVLGSFTPSAQPGIKISVFIYQNASGSTQFVTASSAFVPPAGSTGVRFFNGARIPEDLYVTDGITGNDTPVVSGLAPGTASDYVSVPAGPRAVIATFAGSRTQTTVWVGQNFAAGSNMTFAIPDYGTSTPPYSPDCARASVGRVP
jgi:hypothetical protein